MKRLEVSGAVRPLRWSLDVKGLNGMTVKLQVQQFTLKQGRNFKCRNVTQNSCFRGLNASSPPVTFIDFKCVLYTVPVLHNESVLHSQQAKHK
jgi:hypothetical protein